MRRFLLHFIMFASGVIVVIAAGELIIRHAPNPLRQKHEYVTEHGDRISTLILGSSYSYYGINSQELSDSAYNFSYISQQFKYDYLILRDYGHRLVNLRLVVMRVGHSSFDEPPISQLSEWWRLINYRLYTDVSDKDLGLCYNFEISNPTGYVRKLKQILNIGEVQTLPCDSMGNGVDYTLARRKEAPESRAEEIVGWNSYESGQWNAENLRWLDSVAVWCDSRHVQLMLVGIPVTQKAYRLMDERQLRDRRRSLRLHLSKHPKTLVVDMINDRRFDDSDFYDATHLTNDHGALKVSRILRDTLRTMTSSL